MTKQAKIRTFAVVWTIAATVAAPAMAIRIWDPPWVEDPASYPGGAATSQGWEFGKSLDQPDYVDNPFGDPFIEGILVEPQTVPGPMEDPTGQQPPVQTWHVAETGGGLDIHVPNADNPDHRKIIFVQVTSDKGLLQTQPGWSVTPAGSVSFPKPAINLGLGSDDGSWYVYTARFDLDRCPPMEVISLRFPQSTNIEEVHVDTLCIPEPASLGFLAMGGLFAFVRRRKA